MHNDPKRDFITDVASEAAHRMGVAIEILTKVEDGEHQHHGGYARVVALEVLTDVQKAMFDVALRDDALGPGERTAVNG